uniref:Mechanosensitive ion channel MscS domain-containing protein n=1 Tax=Ditylenchus dipsaci TaxID=166011 RepID=A0A915DT50_9BILA
MAGLADPPYPGGGFCPAAHRGPWPQPPGPALPLATGVAGARARWPALVDHGQRAAVRAGAPGGFGNGAVDGPVRFRGGGGGGVLRHVERTVQPAVRGADLHVGPFRIGDVVELVDTLDKPGVKGRVIAINLLFTTLLEVPEAGGALVQVPNSQFFQKSVRRWRGPKCRPCTRTCCSRRTDMARISTLNSAKFAGHIFTNTLA